MGYAMTPSARLDAAFAALADPTRRAIVARLATGEASVTDLAQPFAMSQPAISKHLKVLERAGLISRSRDAQRRPCRLQPERLKTIAEWVGTYRQFWEEGLDRLDRDILRAICEKFDGGPVGLSTLAIVVSEEEDTLEDVYEPYLLQKGFIKRTPRGRVATGKAYEHLGLEAPRGPQGLF